MQTNDTPKPPLQEVDAATAHMMATIQKAQDTFWQVVAAAYPTAKTGDLSPGASLHFSTATAEAVGEWIDFNVPAGSTIPTPATYELIVRLGSVEDYDEPREADVYTFKTEAERDAFRDGIIKSHPYSTGYDFYTRNADGTIPEDEEWAKEYGDDSTPA